MKEKEEYRQLMVRLDSEDYMKLRLHTVENRLTMVGEVQRMVRKYIANGFKVDGDETNEKAPEGMPAKETTEEGTVDKQERKKPTVEQLQAGREYIEECIRFNRTKKGRAKKSVTDIVYDLKAMGLRAKSGCYWNRSSVKQWVDRFEADEAVLKRRAARDAETAKKEMEEGD